jgi:hypothetical protein
LLLVGGCSFHHGLTPGAGEDGGTIDDAALDAPITMFDAANPACFSRGDYYFCLAAAPSAPLTISTSLIDTGSASNSGCENNFPAGVKVMLQSTPPVTACAFSGTTMTLTGTLSLVGDLPVVFAASSAMTIDGNLDASSAIFGGGGPGATSGACLATSGGANGVGGGGAGGSFLSPGGAGG